MILEKKRVMVKQNSELTKDISTLEKLKTKY